MQFCDPGFERVLSPFDTEALERHPDVVYAVSADLVLRYHNPTWVDFARSNDADARFNDRFGLGASLRDVLPSVLLPFYEEGFRKCSSTGEPWGHAYECSSPETLRLYHMMTYPLIDGGLLVVNTLVKSTPLAHDAAEALEEDYRNEHAFFVQCAHCRKFRRHSGPERWDWIPEWVREPRSGVSHGLCLMCLSFHYPVLPGERT